jgi:putative selenate reductase
VVKKHRAFFPSTEAVQYLSGQPLHVITLNLLDKYRRARPQVPISFSAGVDSRNFAECVALGLTPVTTCTDLLRPGGYARLPRYLEHLAERMRARGVRTVGDFVLAAEGNAEAAVQRAVDDPALQGRLLEAPLREARRIVGEAGRPELYGRLVHEAALRNTPSIVARATADPRYRAEANRAVPRKIGSRLWAFDCINCDKCVPVCPNDANFIYETGALRAEYATYRVQGGAVVAEAGGVFAVEKAHQIGTFQDFCNECGNCDTFCPEDGGPYVEKPRFFGTLDAWRRLERDGFFVERAGGRERTWARLGRAEYRLELDRATGRGVFSDGRIAVEVSHPERRALRAWAETGAPEGHRLDFSAYLTTALAVDGVLDARRANPVNAAIG